MLQRRGLLVNAAASLLFAPAIVKASSIMAVKPVLLEWEAGWTLLDELRMVDMLYCKEYLVNFALWRKICCAENF